jgi:hypothetical protein
MGSWFPYHRTWAIPGWVLWMACAGSPDTHRPGRYAWDNSASAACRKTPAQCASLGARVPLRGPGQTVAAASLTAQRTLRVLDEATQAAIEEELVRCADEARSTVLLKHRNSFKASVPSEAECRQWVKDATGRRVTQAMLLGTEMHHAAGRCIEEKLQQLRPGGFSLEPRYAYSLETGSRRWIRPQEEQALAHSGNGGELSGTLKPDVVLHSGNPLEVQATYDFKFPCVNTDEAPRWSQYPDGHPYEDFTQGQMYEKALGVRPARVVPRLGIFR